jgi:branched-chain amino acid transport system ATP-binding protein
MLKIKDLVVKYGAAIALDGISLEVDEGEIVALIGANGAGKTTTLKAISGLIVPESGEITFLGKKIGGSRPDVIIRQGITHVPQGRRLFPEMTVLENIMLGAYLRKDKEGIQSSLREIFKLFPALAERKKQRAGTLSGGEQQMVALARGIMSNPKLMLLDEPCLGLAPAIVLRVAELVQKLRDQGITILLVEQNSRVAFKVSDRGYVMAVGKIVLEGNTSALMNDDRVKRAYLGETK